MEPLCLHCEGPINWDYPICNSCAPTFHFPYREDCIHCDLKRDLGSGDVDAQTLRVFQAWLVEQLNGPTKWAVVNPLTELKRFAQEKGIDL
jgi:hypothetical protein